VPKTDGFFVDGLVCGSGVSNPIPGGGVSGWMGSRVAGAAVAVTGRTVKLSCPFDGVSVGFDSGVRVPTLLDG